jgi:regulator of replication initiation timing
MLPEATGRRIDVTKDEALRKVEGWSPRENTTYEALRSKYRELREEGGPGLYITRKLLAEAYGSNSIGTASKFLGVIEAVEGDQPHIRRAAGGPEAASPTPHSPAVQAALDGIQAALGRASDAIAEARAREGVDAAARYQRVLDDRQAAANADIAALEERIADLESAASGSGEESFDAGVEVAELRNSLSVAEAARDEASATAQDVTQRLEVELAHANAARAEIKALRGQIVEKTAAIADLKADARWHREAVELGHRLRLENAALNERAGALAYQIAHMETLLREANERHQRERSEMRAEFDRAMAEECKRAAAREALLMQMSGSSSQERGGRS